MQLLYSDSCQYCRTAAAAVRAADLAGRVETLPLESERGRALVEDVHGEYLHSPHLLTDEMVYYGVGPVLRALATRLPGLTLGGLPRATRRAFGRF